VSAVQVLVVDDNEAIRSSVAELLRSAGYSVAEAPDGDSAIAVLGTTDVGVVLLDLKMPGGGGLAVLEGIENPPPIILMSAFVLDEEEQQRVDAKIFVQLVKPFHPRRLLDAVSSAIGSPDNEPHGPSPDS